MKNEVPRDWEGGLKQREASENNEDRGVYGGKQEINELKERSDGGVTEGLAI